MTCYTSLLFDITNKEIITIKVDNEKHNRDEGYIGEQNSKVGSINYMIAK